MTAPASANVKVSEFVVALDRASPIYYPGDAVSGKLRYKVAERLKVVQVGLVAIGDAYCHWEDATAAKKSKPKPKAKSKKDLTAANSKPSAAATAAPSDNDGYELLFKFEHVFVGRKEPVDVEPGEYAYDFRIYLPPDLPSSYENPNARIRYEFIGSIQLEASTAGEEQPSLLHTSRTINVSSGLDLNQIPGLGQPSVTSQCETAGYCCRSEPIEATLATRKSGFVPGEAIVLDVTIDNHRSTRARKAPAINFIESVQLVAASGRTRSLARTISSLTLPRGIEPRGIEEYNGLVIDVPAVCPSFASSSVVRLSYFIRLEFEAKVIGDLLIPVVIGTYPINDYYSAIPSHVYQASVFGPNQAQFLTDRPARGRLLYSDANTFVPYYPFYQLPSAPPRPLTPMCATPLVSEPTSPRFTPRPDTSLSAAVTTDRAGFDQGVQGAFESLTPIYITLKPDPQKDSLPQVDEVDNAATMSPRPPVSQQQQPLEPVYVTVKSPEPPVVVKSVGGGGGVDAETQTSKDGSTNTETTTPIPAKIASSS